jgi:hypothetical protein
MGLEERLHELKKNGDRDLADSLARGAVSSQPVTDVELTDTAVVVETKAFRGRHTLSPTLPEIRERAQSDESLVDGDDIEVDGGTYCLKSERTDYEIEMANAPREDIISHLKKEHLIGENAVPDETPVFGGDRGADTNDTEAEEGESESESSETSETEVVETMTDGGRPRDERSGDSGVIQRVQEFLGLSP